MHDCLPEFSRKAAAYANGLVRSPQFHVVALQAIFFVWYSFLIANEAQAGPGDDNKGAFFPDNFASSIGDTSLDARPTNTPQTPTPLPKNSGEAKTSASEDNSSTGDFREIGVDPTKTPMPSPTEGNTSAAIEDTNEVDPFEKIPVKSLGMVVAATSPSLNAILDRASNLASKCDLGISQISIVSDFDFTKPPPNLSAYTMKFSARQGQVDLVGEVPQNLGIKTSPAWLLSTSKGLVVIEGAPDISKYLDAKCNYVDNPAW